MAKHKILTLERFIYVVNEDAILQGKILSNLSYRP